MNKLSVISAALLLLGLGISAHAITIDTVTVGDPGNKADTTGYGSVSYAYNIGKYEVTAGQYCAFLNAVAKTDIYGLYNSNMWESDLGCKIQQMGSTGSYSYSVASDYANRPVNYVGFWDACRFTNWLSNGQKTGAQDATTTEDGAYYLNGYNSIDGRTIQRRVGWQWAVTSEDEWYKAAYYKGGETDSDYWLYPTQSNTIDTGMANYDDSVATATNVGSYPYASAYGTLDQGGNVWEWTEAIPYSTGTYACRGLRGGSFAHHSDTLQSWGYLYGGPTDVENTLGFRVVQAVPEPSSIIALLGGLTGLIGLKRRRA